MIGGSGPIGTYHVGVPAFRKSWMTVKLNVPAFRKGRNAPKLTTVTAEADAESMLRVESEKYPESI